MREASLQRNVALTTVLVACASCSSSVEISTDAGVDATAPRLDAGHASGTDAGWDAGERAMDSGRPSADAAERLDASSPEDAATQLDALVLDASAPPLPDSAVDVDAATLDAGPPDAGAVPGDSGSDAGPCTPDGARCDSGRGACRAGACCLGCWDGTTCIDPRSDMCGRAGDLCVVCDDGNPCSTDVCLGARCSAIPIETPVSCGTDRMCLDMACVQPITALTPDFRYASASFGPDIDGDGVGDIAISYALYYGGPLELCTYSGADNSVIWCVSDFPDVGYGIHPVSLGGDVDGDGIGDIAVSLRAVGYGLAELRSGADGARLRSWAGTGGEFAWDVAVGGDADGDGRADIMITCRGGCGTEDDPTMPTPARVWSGRTGAVLWRAPLGPHQVGFGFDANGDGLADAVTYTWAPSVYEPDVAHVWSLATGVETRAISLGGRGVSGERHALSLGPDVDGDGLADVAVAIHDDRSVGVFSSATSTALVREAPLSGPWAARLGPDTDGDHVGDVAVVASVWTGNYDSFVRLSATGTRWQTWSARALQLGSDVDGDGLADVLLTAHHSIGTTYVGVVRSSER